jgi:hypothetical protein
VVDPIVIGPTVRRSKQRQSTTEAFPTILGFDGTADSERQLQRDGRRHCDPLCFSMLCIEEDPLTLVTSASPILTLTFQDNLIVAVVVEI